MYGNLLEIPQKGSAKKAEDKVYSFDFSTRTYKEIADDKIENHGNGLRADLCLKVQAKL